MTCFRGLSGNPFWEPTQTKNVLYDFIPLLCTWAQCPFACPLPTARFCYFPLFDLFNAVFRSVDINKNKDIKNTVKEEIGRIFVWKTKSIS